MASRRLTTIKTLNSSLGIFIFYFCHYKSPQIKALKTTPFYYLISLEVQRPGGLKQVFCLRASQDNHDSNISSYLQILKMRAGHSVSRSKSISRPKDLKLPQYLYLREDITLLLRVYIVQISPSLNGPEVILHGVVDPGVPPRYPFWSLGPYFPDVKSCILIAHS